MSKSFRNKIAAQQSTSGSDRIVQNYWSKDADRDARLRAIEKVRQNSLREQEEETIQPTDSSDESIFSRFKNLYKGDEPAAGDNRTTAKRPQMLQQGNSMLMNPYATGNTAATGANIDYTEINKKATEKQNIFNNWKGLIGSKSQEQTISKEQSLAHANEIYAPYKDNQEVTDLLKQYVSTNDDLENLRMHGASADQKYHYVREKQKLEKEIRNITGLSKDDFNQIAENYTYLRHDEERKAQQEKLDNASGLEKAALTGLNVATSAIGNYQSAVGLLKKPNDEELGRDYNSVTSYWRNLSSDAKEAVHKDIDESTMADYQKALAGFGYDAFTMGAESAASQLLGGAGLASFFAGGYASSLEEAEQRGLTKGQAQGYALVSGGLEYATEKIPFDNLKNIFKGKAVGKEAVKGSLMPYVKALFKQAKEEATEEVINGVGDILADALINSDKSKINIAIQNYMQEEGLSEEEATRKAFFEEGKDILYAAASAAVSAGASAGPALTVQAYETTKAGRNLADYENKTGNLTRNVENENYIPETRENYVADEDYRQAQETRQAILAASEKAAKGERISGREARALAESYGQTADNLRTAQKVEGVKLIEGARAKAEEKAIEQIKEASTPAEVETIKEENINSEVVQAAVAEKKAEMIETGKATEAEFTEAITPTKAAAMAESGETIEQEVLEQLPEKVQQAYETGKASQANKLTSDVSKMDISTIEYANSEGKKIHADIKSVSENENGEIVFNLSNGETVKAAEVDYTPNGRQLYNSPNGINSLDNPTLIQLAIDIERNSKHGVAVGNVTLALKDMYTMGAAGLDFDQAIKSRDFDLKTLGKDNLRAAYEEGKKNSTATSRATAAKKGKGLIREATEENSADYKKQFADEATQNEYENQLSESNKKFLELFSRKIGVDIAFFNENSQDRGSYRPDEGKIYLNLYHSHNMFNVALHEGIGEFMAASNEKAYNAIVDSILNAYAATNSTKLANDIRAYQKAYEGDKFGESARGAAQELFNDALSSMFSSEANMKKMYDWMLENEGEKQAKKVKKTLSDYFKSVVETIKEVITEGRFSKSEERQLKLSEDQANKYVDQILKAMDEAIANRDVGNVSQGESTERNSLDIYHTLESSEKKYIEKELLARFKHKENTTFDTVDGNIGIRNNRSIYIVKHIEYTDSDFDLEYVYDVAVNEKDTTETSWLMGAIEEYEQGKKYRKLDRESFSRLCLGHRSAHLSTGDFIRVYGLRNGKTYTRFRLGKTGRVLQSDYSSYRVGRDGKANFDQRSGYSRNSIAVEKLNNDIEETARHSFAGINSQTADRVALNLAKDMYRDGEDDLTILAATGWFKGADNMWKYEIPDNDAEIFKQGNAAVIRANNEDFRRYEELFNSADWSDEALAEMEELEERMPYYEIYGEAKSSGKLTDFLNHDKLFEAYPFLRNINVSIESLPFDTRGQYESGTNTIKINTNLLNHSAANHAIKSTMMHEIQHAIQSREGFGYGSSPEYWNENRESTLKFEKAQLEKTKANLQKEKVIARTHNKPASTKEFTDQYSFDIEDEEKYWDALNAFQRDFEVWKEGNIYQYEDQIKKLERHIENLELMTDDQLYKNTSGEVEARDVQQRLNMTSEERTKKMPELNEDNVVYSLNRWPQDRRFSIKIDSAGRELSKGQQKYFKDSKVIDEEGRLRVVYHGTMADFTIFDLKEARDTEDIEAFFFSGDYEESSGYGNVGEYYLNITNPADYDTAYDIFFKYKGKEHAGRLAREELQSMGYDGVIAVDEDTPEYTEYLVFDSNQIKRVDNKKPTANLDVRKSIKVDDQGREIAPGMQQYLKDNADVFFDKNGAVKNYYHGTRYAGFTQFSLSMMDDKQSIFLTDNKGTANTYAGNHDLFEPDKEWTYSQLENAISYMTGGDWEVDKDGDTITITEYGFGDEADKETQFDSILAAQTYFIDNFLNKIDLRSDENAAIYNVYVKSSNPYVVEADGNTWDEIFPSDYAKHYTDVNITETDGTYQVDYQDGNKFYNEVFNSNAELEAKFGELLEDFENSTVYIENLYLDKNNNRIPTTTRQFAKIAKQQGYDSLVVNNVVDTGIFGNNEEKLTPSQVVVVFDGSQVKSVHNPNPTEDKDIRYSISVDDDRVYYYHNVEIVKNPTSQEYKQMRADIIKERPWLDIPGEPLLRHTYDEDGNEYYWAAYDGMHWAMEQGIAEHWKTRVNQQYEWWKDPDKDFWANRSFRRYSKVVFGEESQYSSQIEQTKFVSQILSTLNNQLKGTTVSLNYLDDTVKYIIKKYEADIDAEDLKMELAQFIAYMTSNDHVDYDQMMNYLLNVGDEVIKASQLKDPEEERIYNELKNELSSYKISLTDTERKELISRFGGSWNAVFGKLNSVGIKLNNTGQHMDGGIYSQVVDKFREIAGVSLDDEVTSIDQIATIIDAMDALTPGVDKWEGATDMDKALDVATTIIDKYYSMATAIKESNIAKSNEKGKAAIERAKQNEIKKLRAKQQEYKAKINEEFQQLVEDRKKVVQEQQEFYRRQAEIEKKFKGEQKAFDRRMNMSSKELEKTARLQAQMQYQGIKDTEAKRKQKDNIVRTCMRLINWMNKPTDTRHVPAFMQPALTEFIKSINFMPASMRKGNDGTISAIKWQESMRKLQQVIKAINSSDVESISDADKVQLALVMDAEELTKKMDIILNKYGGTADISRMAKEDLKTLSDIMTSISKGISQMNENFMNRRYKHVGELAEASMNEMQELKPIADTTTSFKDKAADFLNLDMLEPISFFEELGEASGSVMQEFFDGEKTGIEIIREAENFFDDLAEELNVSKAELRSWSNDVKSYNIDGGLITLSSADVMSLYCSYKREMLDQEERPFEATHHIAAGGIKGFKNTYKKGKGIKKYVVNRNARALHANQGMILELINSLDVKQQAYADRVVEYMSTTLAEHGNETSNKMNGYSKYLGKYYFPLKTENNAIATTESNNQTGLAGMLSIVHQSFTKSQLDKADNALVVMDFFDVVTEHITGMANYCAYSMPLSDALRWFNYASTERNNTENENEYLRETRSIKGSMDRVKGKNARTYFENFLRAVNLDPARTGGSAIVQNLARTLTGLGRAKAVALNGSVWVQQPTAITRAADVIENKYLAKGWAKMSKNPKAATEYAQEKSYLCYWKNKGFSDYRVTVGMKEIITGYETKMQELQEYAGAPAGILDDTTWAAMYYAAEYKIKETTDLQEGSEEFHAAVEELFSDIINHTQVIDSNLRTTQTMKGRNDFEYLANAFKKEPQKTYNMLHRAGWELYQYGTPEAKEKWHKALRVFIVSAIINALFRTPFLVIRDDEDEEFIKKYLKKLLPYESFEVVKEQFEKPIDEWSSKDIIPLLRGVWGGKGAIGDNLDVFSSMPLVAEIDSWFQGFSPSTLSYTSILTEANKTVNSLSSATATPYNLLYSVASFSDYVTGLGISNLMKDLRGFWNQTTRLTNLPRIEKSTANEAKAAKTKQINALKDAVDSAAAAQTSDEKSKAKTDIDAAVNAIYQEKYDLYINDKEKPKTEKEADKEAKEQTASTITRNFKPIYTQLVADKKLNEATNLMNNLIYAYSKVGYKKTKADFDEWLKE